MRQHLPVVLVLLAPLVLSAPPPPGAAHVVSLQDVTGTTPRPSQVAALTEPQGYTEVGYPSNPLLPAGYPRPGQVGGVVSLEDVTGLGHPRRPSGSGQVGGVVSLEDVTGIPRPSQPGAAYVYNSPCYALELTTYTVPQTPGNSVLQRPSRYRRSPSPLPGVVRLEDVAGPGAGRYPSYGPPAYVRPSNYPYWYYNRPRPYPPYYVVPLRPCVGYPSFDGWLAHRPVLPVNGVIEHLHTSPSASGASGKIVQQPADDDDNDDIPREFVRSL